MPATYEKIATTTLGSAAASIDFTSIAASWTDLRLVLVATHATSSTENLRLQFNGATTGYSTTYLGGNGTTVTSARTGSGSYMTLNPTTTLSNTIPSLTTIDIFSYAGSTNKTLLSMNNSDYNGSGAINPLVGLYASTSAITSIKLFPSGSTNFAIGTTATLYGILKA